MPQRERDVNSEKTTAESASLRRRLQDELPTRRSLLTRLKRWDDREGWREFFDTYWKLIYAVALRSGLNETEAEDIVQDTVSAVAQQMPRFKYDPALGSFKAWLLLITRRRIMDHLRKEYRRPQIEANRPGETSRTDKIERVPDPVVGVPDEVWEEEWQRQLLDKALKVLKQEVEPKQFQVFDCYVLKEWPVKDVAETFHVTANQIYLIKHRLSALLAKEVKRLESGERLKG
jgi:RNA polymerase sigma-70 factor (ECF subfamily)